MAYWISNQKVGGSSPNTITLVSELAVFNQPDALGFLFNLYLTK